MLSVPERARGRERERERVSGGESLEGAGSREICLLCVTSPWDDPVIIMNVLVVPRISSSPLSPFASPHPFNLVEGILDASFHRFFFPGATIIRGSVSLSKSKSPPYRSEDSMKRAKTNWNYCIGEGGRRPDSLFPFPLKQRGEKTQPEGFPNRSLRAVPSLPVVSLENYLCPLRSLSLSFFLHSSKLTASFHLPLFHLGPRDSSDSRPRRFQSCLVEVSTRSHLPLPIFPSNLLPFPTFPSLALAFTKRRGRESEREREREENGRCVYIDRSGRIECSLEGNSRSLPQEIRETRDPSHPSSILPLFFCFFLFPSCSSSFLSLSLFPKIRLL